MRPVCDMTYSCVLFKSSDIRVSVLYVCERVCGCMCDTYSYVCVRVTRTAHSHVCGMRQVCDMTHSCLLFKSRDIRVNVLYVCERVCGCMCVSFSLHVCVCGRVIMCA